MEIIQKIIKDRIFLAPMAGINDRPFRRIVRMHGARFVFIEMIDINGMFYGNRKTYDLLEYDKNDTPIGVQLVGQDENRLEIAAKICGEKGFDMIELNASCPARKVVISGKGSALLREPVKLARVLKRMVRSVNVPVGIKIRSGWDDSSMNYIDIGKLSESEGVSYLTVHPRTQSQAFKGTADHNVTRILKENVKIPVFASGDMFSPGKINEVFDHTGCDAISIARGALGRPWLFGAVNDNFEGKNIQMDKSLDEIKSIMLEHFRLSVETEDPGRILGRMYKHVCWYLRGYKNIDGIMKHYRELNEVAEVYDFIDRIALDESGRRLIIY